jgi:hypothetical protein
MTQNEFILKIKGLLAEDAFKAALETATGVLDLSGSRLKNDLILLSNRFHQFQAAVRNGTIEPNAAQANQTKLVQSFIGLLDEWPRDEAIRQYFRQATMETVHQGNDPTEDLLAETLHRHVEDQGRESKNWILTAANGQPLVEISTVDPRPQGAFFTKSSRITFGRSPECDIVIHDLYVSRLHATLEVRGQEVWLRDQGSSNGTYWEGEKVEAAVPVRNGSLLVDKIMFEIRME